VCKIALLGLIMLPPASLSAEDALPKFLGAQSCAAGSCHGGGAVKHNEFTLWSRRDFHHERPVALLETRRATVIADALGIAHPLQDKSCTACHAPLQTVPPDRLAPEANIMEGVSCENCHAPAQNWIRSHTRTDWTTADRVFAGMRDLKNLYVRANTCVACHQNVDFNLRRAGHPELTFELDGQCAAEPRHWQKSADKPGPQIWLVGQAVALREMTWQLSRETVEDQNLREEQAGLLWLMQTVENVDAAHVGQWSDDFAKATANLAWSDDLTRDCLTKLASAGDAFADSNVPVPVRARRAGRLVLALDRLLISPAPKLSQALDRLFADAQSIPDFDPEKFARHLNEFHAALADVSK
jgi:hypothetical protein